MSGLGIAPKLRDKLEYNFLPVCESSNEFSTNADFLDRIQRHLQDKYFLSELHSCTMLVSLFLEDICVGHIIMDILEYKFEGIAVIKRMCSVLATRMGGNCRDLLEYSGYLIGDDTI